MKRPEPPAKLPPFMRRKGHAFYFDAGGKPRRWIPLGSDYATALRRYDDIKAKRVVVPRTVGAILADYVDNLTGKAPSTMSMYGVFHTHVHRVFGSIQADKLTQADVLQYLDRCPRTSGRGEISLLSCAYRRAMRNGLLTFNPCIGARSEKPRARRDRYITDAELAAARAVARPILQVAIDLAYLTGLRVSDLCALRWDQFEPDGFIRTQKTGVRQRYVLTEDLATVLEAARALQGRVASVYVLCKRAGQPLSRQDVGDWWRAACKRAGVKDAHWHDIRAKTATDADTQGQDATKLLGHADVSTTRTYLRGRRIVNVEPLRRKRGA